ncbi:MULTISPECIES: phage antirepressor KilAC domain-containing protein [Klebsiella]|uniref:phage antirepressor KilAC domain-containing protein n=1 Tax=Klebsiella TaxID=570 RepID=UPI0015E94BAA|nr:MULTISPECIES: phage regulatory protein/antirepressor Ant [Klebsiella]MBD7761053.1 phage regulatory protein/antirepressor Ant [Klebsiella pneumoniae]MBD7776127.1 phage regulatory protein/antirepressor Ant [Klebsiella pneumoniae]MDX6818407.1 phage regulatory protein/antirepressor Ant [Klebsiella oxytoca]QMR68300.1 phage antirepressor KilAC domain-containing protein [Klebsiella grimontii]HBQ2094518.1 phage regulatory protein/antirepressor Ant [Klebsiella pneumoniae]
MAQWINNLPVSSAASVPAFTDSSVTMSSREIAELTEKQHGHVCRDIEAMLKQLGESPEGYIQLWTHPQNGQKYREYRLDREHTECLITGYSAVLRMKIIRRLRELEDNTNAIPQTLPEALRLAADMAEQNARLSHKVQQDAPKVAFVNQYVEAGGAKSLRETAKILNMPEKAMIDTLLRDKVLFRQSGNLLPHALRQREGLFTVKTGTSDFGHAYTQTRVTPRGVQWIAQRYASELMGG